MVRGLKKAWMSLAVAALVLAFVLPASAQRRPMDRAATPAAIPVNEMLGMDVRTMDGDTVGRIDDLMVTRQGTVRDVIVDLDATGDRVAVPMQDLRFNRDYASYRGSRADLEDRAGAVYGYRADREDEQQFGHVRPRGTGEGGHWRPSWQRQTPGTRDVGRWPSGEGVIGRDRGYYDRGYGR